MTIPPAGHVCPQCHESILVVKLGGIAAKRQKIAEADFSRWPGDALYELVAAFGFSDLHGAVKTPLFWICHRCKEAGRVSPSDVVAAVAN